MGHSVNDIALVTFALMLEARFRDGEILIRIDDELVAFSLLPTRKQREKAKNLVTAQGREVFTEGEPAEFQPVLALSWLQERAKRLKRSTVTRSGTVLY